MSKFKVGDRVRHNQRDDFGSGTITSIDKTDDTFLVLFDCGIIWYSLEESLTLLRKVSPRKEKKKRPAYWVEVENRRGVITLYLRGRNNFKLVQFYKKYNVAVQQAKRLAKQLGLEVRK